MTSEELEPSGVVMRELIIATLPDIWDDPVPSNLVIVMCWYDEFLNGGDADLDKSLRITVVGKRAREELC